MYRINAIPTKICTLYFTGLENYKDSHGPTKNTDSQSNPKE